MVKFAEMFFVTQKGTDCKSAPAKVTRSFTYDSKGRTSTITETIGTESCTTTFVYDTKGRLSKKYFDGSDYEQYYYNSFGYLNLIKFNGATVWQKTGMDEYGRLTTANIGSSSCTWSYNSSTQMLSQIYSYGNQYQKYDFDVNTGNLDQRINQYKGLTEDFAYDNLDRLTGVSTNASQSLNYLNNNNNGNFNYKSDAGTYEYNTADAKPYQLVGINNVVDVDTAHQEIDYYWFDKIEHIEQSGKTADFDYNADFQRIRMVLKTGTTTTKTRYYFGSQIERDVVGSTETDYYWIGGDAYTAVAVAKKTSTGTTVYNIFRDPLGTITHLKNGSNVDEYSFDAWGRRRDKDDWDYTLSGEPSLFAHRGFTAHEHLENFNLINMNGRLYDPVVGRFLSPDPFVQAPDYTQNFNRYSYALNNPLIYTDPSGEFWQFAFSWLGAMAGNYAMGVADNVINKGIPLGQAMGATPIMGNMSYSPSGNTVFNNQVNAQAMPGIMAAGQQGIANNIAGLQDWSSWEPTGVGDVINQSFVGQSPLVNNIAKNGIDAPHGVFFFDRSGEMLYKYFNQEMGVNWGRTDIRYVRAKHIPAFKRALTWSEDFYTINKAFELSKPAKVKIFNDTYYMILPKDFTYWKSLFGEWGFKSLMPGPPGAPSNVVKLRIRCL